MLKTEERSRTRKNSNDSRSEIQSCQSTGFKARQMPIYKFFEVLHPPQKEIKAVEFNLSSKPRRSNSAQENGFTTEGPVKFQALPMPNFSKPKTAGKAQVAKSTLETQPFNLGTEARGRAKM